MSHDLMFRTFKEESDSGVLVTVPVFGRRLPGAVTLDRFIIGFIGQACNYCHVYEARSSTLERSLERLDRAYAALPLATAPDHGQVFQYVFESDTDIVAALLTGTNPGGDLFGIVAHHGDIPGPIALAIVRDLYATYMRARDRSN